MIRTLRSEGGGFQAILPIAREAPEGVNWITVFIAENGGRKSFLLRCLTEAALGNSRYASQRNSKVTFARPIELPERVIAISGTPLDRFPRAGTRDLRSKRKAGIYEDNFVYLGQRASNGMSGLAQSERSLVGSLLSNRHRLKERGDQLARVFGHLGLEPTISVKLRVSNSKDPLAKLSEGDFLNNILNNLKSNRVESPESKELLLAVDQLNSESNLNTIYSSLNSIEGGRKVLTIGPQRTVPRFGLSVAMWELLLRAGVVELLSTEFVRARRNSNEIISGDQLSSGQWNWLGSFGALVSELRDNCLILVDEPENSLHPSWQRAFMSELYDSISYFKNCQVVVATHSPLIASGVSPAWGNIRTLKRAQRINAVVRSEPLATAFGWNATDVYDELFGLESTRDPEFLALADTALNRISKNGAIPIEDVENWVSSLRSAASTLPSFDPMREIFLDIVATLLKRSVLPRKGKVAP